MATFLPLQNGPTAPQPHHNFIPNSSDMSYKSNLPQQTSSANASNQPSIHNRTPTDLGENAWHGYPSGNGSMEPPLGQPVNMAAGAPRHRNTMSMGALPYDSARSPPNAKSMSILSMITSSEILDSKPSVRYFSRPLQVLQTWPMSSRQSLPLLTFYRHFKRRYALQILFQGMSTPANSNRVHQSRQTLRSNRATASLAQSVL